MKVGDIYFADLSPYVYNEIGGIRPCKIIEIYYGDLVRVQPKVMNTTTMEYSEKVLINHQLILEVVVLSTDISRIAIEYASKLPLENHNKSDLN